MKKGTRTFLRSVYISSTVVFCLIFGFLAAAKAYENTVRIGFGEYKKAVELNDGYFRIFDYEIKL